MVSDNFFTGITENDKFHKIENGFDPDIIEAALAHIGKDEVRNAYNRADYIERRKPVMVWWSDYIENAGTGNISLAGNVRQIKAG